MTTAVLVHTVSQPRLPQRDLDTIRETVLFNKSSGSSILKTVKDENAPDLVQIRQTPSLMGLYSAVSSVDPNRNQKIHFVKYLTLGNTPASAPSAASTPLMVSPNVSAMSAEVLAKNRHALEAHGYSAQETIDLYAYDLTKRVNASLERNGYANFSGSWGDRSTTDVNEYVGWLYQAVAAEERMPDVAEAHGSVTLSATNSSGPIAETELADLKDDVLAALAIERG
ncbi:hypothetical protein [Novosphingobium sp. JCM 18896]|uniref:hypothetical protein n=1 Tax=Novosphingobium sp. JCM 18896 TaxID=2989731 RepID=UPI002222414C|nr:hypothetical protein [Novosphingobium sp. JCM 18896]MCW1431574.1 hypothetical protein [Novosphingobium sp. JCM 18896]